jgi:hypothetical protein
MKVVQRRTGVNGADPGSRRAAWDAPVDPILHQVSRNTTGTPLSMRRARNRASQFVRRTQPADVAYPIVCGRLVPWMP